MPEKLIVFFYVAVAVGIALLGNYLAALWASKDNHWSLLLLAVILISPFVFITFGLVTARVGVAIGSGTIDSLLALGSVLLGLFVFNELNKLSLYEYVGLALILCGILVIHFFPKAL